MSTNQIDEMIEQPAAGEEDVEGHSVLSVLATSGAMRTPAADGKKSSRNNPDENLPPLTKPFPSMRDTVRK